MLSGWEMGGCHLLGGLLGAWVRGGQAGRRVGWQVDTLCIPCCLQKIVEADILLVSNRFLLATWLPSWLAGGCVCERVGKQMGGWVGGCCPTGLECTSVVASTLLRRLK